MTEAATEAVTELTEATYRILSRSAREILSKSKTGTWTRVVRKRVQKNLTMIGQKRNAQLIMSNNLDSLRQKTDNVVRNYKVGESIDQVITDSIQSFYQFNDKNILVIDSVAVYKGLSFRPNYVLLRNSPKLNLNRVIDSIKPELIIADASNYKSYVKRWKATCEHKKIPFHQTNEKGALIIK